MLSAPFSGVDESREAIKIIEVDGWRLVRIKGSHRQFKHPLKHGRITIAGKPDRNMHPKTLKIILNSRKPGVRPEAYPVLRAGWPHAV